MIARAACSISPAQAFSIADVPAPLNDPSPVVGLINTRNGDPYGTLLRADWADESTWRTYKVRVPDGASVVSQIRGEATNPSSQYFGMIWLAPDGSVFSRSDAGFSAGGGGGVLYRDGTVGASLAVPGLPGSGSVVSSMPAGDYIAVFISAAKGPFVGTFEIYSDAPGVQVIATRAGTGAFTYDVTDFPGGRVQVVAGSGDVHVDGSLRKNLHPRAFFVLVPTSEAPTAVVTYKAPDEDAHQLDPGEAVVNGRGGAYTFHLRSEGDASPLIGGAAVVLP